MNFNEFVKQLLKHAIQQLNSTELKQQPFIDAFAFYKLSVVVKDLTH